MLRKIVSSPLSHFMLIGLLIFAYDGWRKERQAKAEREIVISNDLLLQLISLWSADAKRAPTQAEVQGLIMGYAREDILMREAIKLGLDEDDTIIRRRLAQKMEFLLRDRSVPAQVSDQQLKEWFAANADKFKTPAKRSFQHVYFGEDESLPGDTLELLNSGADWRSIGNPFMGGQTFQKQTAAQIRQRFGGQLDVDVFKAKLDTWVGPVKSTFGQHFIRVTDLEEATKPELETIKPRVLQVYKDEEARTQFDNALSELMAQYEVVIEPLEVRPTSEVAETADTQ